MQETNRKRKFTVPEGVAAVQKVYEIYDQFVARVWKANEHVEDSLDILTTAFRARDDIVARLVREVSIERGALDASEKKMTILQAFEELDREIKPFDRNVHTNALLSSAVAHLPVEIVEQTHKEPKTTPLVHHANNACITCARPKHVYGMDPDDSCNC